MIQGVKKLAIKISETRNWSLYTVSQSVIDHSLISTNFYIETNSTLNTDWERDKDAHNKQNVVSERNSTRNTDRGRVKDTHNKQNNAKHESSCHKHTGKYSHLGVSTKSRAKTALLPPLRGVTSESET